MTKLVRCCEIYVLRHAWESFVHKIITGTGNSLVCEC